MKGLNLWIKDKLTPTSHILILWIRIWSLLPLLHFDVIFLKTCIVISVIWLWKIWIWSLLWSLEIALRVVLMQMIVIEILVAEFLVLSSISLGTIIVVLLLIDVCYCRLLRILVDGSKLDRVTISLALIWKVLMPWKWICISLMIICLSWLNSMGLLLKVIIHFY